MAMAGQPIRMASGAFCSARRAPMSGNGDQGQVGGTRRQAMVIPAGFEPATPGLGILICVLFFVYKNTLCRVYVAS
jgi:hypothetical protein